MTNDKSREAFEKAMSAPEFGYDMRIKEGTPWYANADTLSAWFGWQACEARMREEMRELVEALTESARLVENVGAGYGWQKVMQRNREALARLAKQDGGI